MAQKWPRTKAVCTSVCSCETKHLLLAPGLSGKPASSIPAPPIRLPMRRTAADNIAHRLSCQQWSLLVSAQQEVEKVSPQSGEYRHWDGQSRFHPTESFREHTPQFMGETLCEYMTQLLGSNSNDAGCCCFHSVYRLGSTPGLVPPTFVSSQPLKCNVSTTEPRAYVQ